MNRIEEMLQEMCPKGIVHKQLSEIGTFFGGLTGKSKNDFKDGNAKFITYMNVYSNPALKIDINDWVKVAPNERQNTILKGDVLFTGSSETPDECGMTSVVATEINEPVFLNSFCFGFRPLNSEMFNPHFLKHLLRSEDMRKQISKTASGVTRFNVSKARLAKVILPIPPIEVQNEIADILDHFTELAASLQAELQAELQARQEQYEYYRNKLLTFNEIGGGYARRNMAEDE